MKDTHIRIPKGGIIKDIENLKSRDEALGTYDRYGIGPYVGDEIVKPGIKLVKLMESITGKPFTLNDLYDRLARNMALAKELSGSESEFVS